MNLFEQYDLGDFKPSNTHFGGVLIIDSIELFFKLIFSHLTHWRFVTAWVSPLHKEIGQSHIVAHADG